MSVSERWSGGRMGESGQGLLEEKITWTELSAIWSNPGISEHNGM